MARTRESLTLPRMNAQRPVIIAAALTTLAAAALATTFAVFSGVSLPRAVRHSLTAANGTALVISGRADASQAPGYTSLLRQQIRSALEGAPFVLDSAERSDPLGFAGGTGAPPPTAAGGNTPIAEAAVLGGIRAHAVLVSGRWPGPVRSGQPIPAALPETAAALLHVRAGDRLRLRDRVSGRLASFVVTGLYRPRQVAGPAAGYWGLNDIGFTGSSTAGGFTSYGPLTVPGRRLRGPAGGQRRFLGGPAGRGAHPRRPVRPGRGRRHATGPGAAPVQQPVHPVAGHEPACGAHRRAG